LGVLLYDADKIDATAGKTDQELIDAQRDIILDPFDPEVIKEAKENGIHDHTIQAAQESPVYKFVKVWKMALPPHIEYRTLPMLFYVPPMLPVISAMDGDTRKNLSDDLFAGFDQARAPIEFLSNLFSAGDTEKTEYVLRKQMAVRTYRRAVTVGDISMKDAQKMLKAADCTIDEAEAIYKMTSIATLEDRFVVPPAHREEAIEMMDDPLEYKQSAGFGFKKKPERGL
jgi:nitrate reductase beta subunit